MPSSQREWPCPTSIFMTTLETTQGQIDHLFTQLPFRCYLTEVASAGDRLKICPWVASRVGGEIVIWLLWSRGDSDEGISDEDDEITPEGWKLVPSPCQRARNRFPVLWRG